MDLPVRPPVQPMLAKLTRELPSGPQWRYEPKWDGFRCVVFRDGDDVELYSRNERPLGRYFPELVRAFSSLSEPRFVVDGEIVVVRDGRFDFDALLTRLHPSATLVARRAEATPATYVAFDVLAVDGDDVRLREFDARRAVLEALFADAPAPLHVTPLTKGIAIARRWMDEFTGGGLDGVVAKDAASPYQPGKRVMLKVKAERTADCVVAGFRWRAAEPIVSSLLLGLYAARGDQRPGPALRHVGVCSSFSRARRAALVDELRPYVTALEGHPWEHGFSLEGGRLGRLKGTAGRWTPEMGLDWVPVAPLLVCEVAYDQVEGLRFRHPARFVRWRPDRDPSSCSVDQLVTAATDTHLAESVL